MLDVCYCSVFYRSLCCVLVPYRCAVCGRVQHLEFVGEKREAYQKHSQEDQYKALVYHLNHMPLLIGMHQLSVELGETLQVHCSFSHGGISDHLACCSLS